MIDPAHDDQAPWYMVVIPAVLLTLAFGYPVVWLLWVLTQ